MKSRILALTFVVAAALTLGGCDKCGNWVWQSKSCSGAPVR